MDTSWWPTSSEALRLADAERQRQLEQLSMACETLAEARQGWNGVDPAGAAVWCCVFVARKGISFCL